MRGVARAGLRGSWFWRLAETSSRAPKSRVCDLSLDLRQGVARTTQQKYGHVYQELNAWLRDSEIPLMSELARRDLSVVSEILVAYEKCWPHSHGPLTLAAAQYFQRGR